MSLREIPWRGIAWLVTRPRVRDWLVRRAQRTPYSHIGSTDGTDVYMYRWWLFNAYGKDAFGEVTPPRWPWLPSVRIHHIRRKDHDRHEHNHPWNARTIVLRNWYEEVRGGAGPFHRHAGYTGRLLYGEFHRITALHGDGVWTLFITWRKRGTWGFNEDGKFVPYREYLAKDYYVKEASE